VVVLYIGYNDVGNGAANRGDCDGGKNIFDVRLALEFAKLSVGIHKTIRRRQISSIKLALVLWPDGIVLPIRSDPRVQ